MRALKRLLTFIVILFVVLSLIIIGKALIKNINDRLDAPNGLLTVPDNSQKSYLKKLKKQDSDIEGLTKYDKYKKGLSPEDGSDTDGDGLTDKEEIEKYNTNPLKMSTSGDLISDGEKVKRGLDLTKKYDAEITSYPYNECKEVALDADTAEGRLAIIKTPYFHKLKSIKTYQEYYVYSFSGEITISLSKLLKDNNAVADNIAVYIQEDSGKAKKVKNIRFNGDSVSFTIPDAAKHYDIFIAKKAPFADKATVIDSDAEDNSLIGMFNDVNGKTTFNASVSGNDDMDGIAFGAPLLHFLSGEIKIYYYDTGDEEKNKAEIKTLVKRANSIDEANMTTDSKNIRKASKTQIKALYKIFNSILPECNGSGYDKESKGWDLLFYFERFSSANDNLAKTDDNIWKNVSTQKSDTGFTFGKDQFAFPNITSKVTGGGLCAGFATYTAKVFNSGEVTSPLSDVVLDHSGNSYPWDISGNTYKKLRTKGQLYSYKNKDYVKEHNDKDGYMTKDMTAEDNNLLNMLTWYWAKANYNTLPDKKSYIPSATAHEIGTYDYQWDTIKYIMKQMDNGKIVSVATQMGNDKSTNKSGCGHEINLVNYVVRDDGSVKFRVYDSNYPKGGKLYMYVTKRYDSFDYIYQPDPENNNYVMTSYKTSGFNKFTVTDENDFSNKAIVKKNKTGYLQSADIEVKKAS